MEDKLNVLAPKLQVEEIDKNNLTVVLEPFEKVLVTPLGIA